MTRFLYHFYAQLCTQCHSEEESVRQLCLLQVSKLKPQLPVILTSLKQRKSFESKA